jgi:uncharacterized protein
MFPLAFSCLSQWLDAAALDDVQQFQRRARRPALAAFPLADRVYRDIEKARQHGLAHSCTLAHLDDLGRGPSEEPRFSAFATIAGYYAEASEAASAAARSSLERAQAAERRWRETGIAETIPAVAADNGDVAMALDEAFAYYGTSRGAVPNYVNGFAVQSRVHTMAFDALGAAHLIKVPTVLLHSENALAPALARCFQADLDDARIIWLPSLGQIDFYDDKGLIAQGADAVVEFLATRLNTRSRG